MYRINPIQPRGNANIPKIGIPPVQHIKPKNTVATLDIIINIPDKILFLSIIIPAINPTIKNGNVNNNNNNNVFPSVSVAVNVVIKYISNINKLTPEAIKQIIFLAI